MPKTLSRDMPTRASVDPALLPELIGLWHQTEDDFFWNRAWQRVSEAAQTAIILCGGFAGHNAAVDYQFDRRAGRSLIERAIRSATGTDFQKALIRHKLDALGADPETSKMMAGRIHAQMMAYIRSERVLDMKSQGRKVVGEWRPLKKGKRERTGTVPALERLQKTAPRGGLLYAKAWAALSASAKGVLDRAIRENLNLESDAAFWQGVSFKPISGQLLPDPTLIAPHLKKALALATERDEPFNTELRDKTVELVFAAFASATGRALTIKRDGEGEVVEFLREIETIYADAFNGLGVESKSALAAIAKNVRDDLASGTLDVFPAMFRREDRRFSRSKKLRIS